MLLFNLWELYYVRIHIIAFTFLNQGFTPFILTLIFFNKQVGDRYGWIRLAFKLVMKEYNQSCDNVVKNVVYWINEQIGSE